MIAMSSTLFSCSVGALLLSIVVAAHNNNRVLYDREKQILSLPLIPHHVQRRRHLQAGRKLEKVERPFHYPRRNLQGDKQVAALFQGYGTHYADLWCGTPPQRQTVIVDTGSGVTAFPCTGCPPAQCGVPDYHLDPLFDTDASSTYHKLSCNECFRGSCSTGDECRIGMSYQEGSSWSASEVVDSCYVGGLHNDALVEDDNGTDDLDPFHAPAFAFDLKFGCQTRITGLFKTQLADGIMGMDIAKAAFWAQMYDAHKVQKKAFSLCFSRQDSVSREGTSAGAMTMGGSDDRLHDHDMVYSSTDKSDGFFDVYIRKVYLREGGGGGSAVSTNPDLKVVQLSIAESDLNRGNVIVDSGTTDTYFTRSIQGPFQTAWKSLVGSDYTHSPLSLTKEQLDKYPTILIQLHGDETLNKAILDESSTGKIGGLAGDVDPDHPYDIILAIPPSHYFEYDEDINKYVARFYTDEGSGSVLGANSMMGHDVLFDVENYRIGWAESPCDYKSLVMKYSDAGTLPEDSNRLEPTTESKGVEPTVDGEVEVDDEVMSDHETGDGFCSSFSCQAGIVAGLVAVVALVTFRLVKGSGGASYEMASSELELRSDPINSDDDFVPRYRDHPSGDEIAEEGIGYNDDDKEVSGTLA